MATAPATVPAFDVFGLGPDQARRDWRPFLAWGLVLAGVGAVTVGLPFATGPGAAWLFGVLLMVGGAVQLTTAVRAWEWGGLRPRGLTGAVYLTLGAVLAGLPANVWLTLVLAVGLAVGGVLRAGGAVAERFAGRGWVLASGLLAMLVGGLVGEQWPDAGLWAVGLLAGVDLATSGLTWVMFARGVRAAPAAE
ncbi:MAG TPA: DUF308 domain-containing protein [Fimbriiglobus sp.]|nr:DUF308 domain-containing protein [Fimbriiglobus sp.]